VHRATALDPGDAAQHVDLGFADELGDEQIRRIVEYLAGGTAPKPSLPPYCGSASGHGATG